MNFSTSLIQNFDLLGQYQRSKRGREGPFDSGSIVYHLYTKFKLEPINLASFKTEDNSYVGSFEK